MTPRHCPHCQTTFLSDVAPRFCEACGGDLQAPAAAGASLARPAPSSGGSSEGVAAASTPLLGLPSIGAGPAGETPSLGAESVGGGQAATGPDSQVPGATDRSAAENAPEAKSRTETGRLWGDLISNLLFLLVGAFVALIGIENSEVALTVGLVMVAISILGLFLSHGYTAREQLSSASRFIVGVPAFCFAMLGLITIRAIGQLLKRKVYGPDV